MLTFFLVSLLLAESSADNCTPYPNAHASSCSRSDQNNAAFNSLNIQLVDAQREHFPNFILNTTLGMYKFLHPCSQTAEAALHLFFNYQDGLPHHDSAWWRQWAFLLGEAVTHAPVAKRQRDAHYNSEEELLFARLRELDQATGGDGGCIAFLVERYAGVAGLRFRQLYPQFNVPRLDTTSAIPQTTTTQKPTTTPAPTTTTEKTTTTPKPTTTTEKPTTTPEPTKTTEGPTTTTEKPTLPTSVTTAVPLAPGECTDCSMLNCLLSPHVITCPEGSPFCLTTVTDQPTGSVITRGCATQETCRSIQNLSECSDIETQRLPSGSQCQFCCLGQNCNKPPHLIPETGTLYQAP